MLEYLYLDVKVRSPREIQALTDERLAEERIELATVPSPDLVAKIRSSIEVLLAIKQQGSSSQLEYD